MCVAQTDEGGVVTSANPTGGAAAWTLSAVALADPSDMLTALSCPSTTLCVAIDSEGGAYTSSDPAGGRATWRRAEVDPPGIGRPRQLNALACPSVSACVAVDSVGSAASSTEPAAVSSAWTSASVDLPSGCQTAPCVVEQLYAHDGKGTRVVDSTPPGTGTSLLGVVLTGDALSWSHDGVARQTALG
jgi:hypothetical protein